MSTSPNVVKTVFNGDIRRFALDGKSFAELHRNLVQNYCLPPAACLHFKYEDDEGEWITVTSDAELEEAFRVAAHQQKAVLRLHAFPSQAPPAGPVPSQAPPASAHSEHKIPLAHADGVPSTPAPPGGDAVSVAAPPSSAPAPSDWLESFVELSAFLKDDAVKGDLQLAVQVGLFAAAEGEDAESVLTAMLATSDRLRSHRSLTALRPLLVAAVARASVALKGLKDQPDRLRSLQATLPQLLPLLPLLLDQAAALLQLLPSSSNPLSALEPLAQLLAPSVDPLSASDQSISNIVSALSSFRPFCAPYSQSAQTGGPAPCCSSTEAPSAPSAPPNQSPSPAPAPPPAPAPSHAPIHWRVSCDGCGMAPIRGARFKCSICSDFDLCESCESLGTKHDPAHPLVKLKEPHASCHPMAHRGGPLNSLGRILRAARRSGHGRGHGRSDCVNWRLPSSPAPGAGPLGTARPRAEFVRDVSLPHRTVVGPGQTLIKTWQLLNCGDAAWPPGTRLVFLRGDRQLSAEEEFEVPCAQPAETVEVSAVVTTGQEAGRFTAYYRLADASRDMFGPRVWVDIVVDTSCLSESGPEAKLDGPACSDAPVPSATGDPTLSDVDPIIASKYGLQLQILASMGYRDMALNASLLQTFDGDLQKTYNTLLLGTQE